MHVIVVTAGVGPSLDDTVFGNVELVLSLAPFGGPKCAMVEGI